MIAKMKAESFCCSFCGKSRSEVDNIMAGAPQATPGVPRTMVGKSAFICNVCVRRCTQLVAGPDISQGPAIFPKKDLTL